MSPRRRRVADASSRGIALGIGGLAGGYVGATMDARMPEKIIRRLLAFVVIAIGIRYLTGGA